MYKKINKFRGTLSKGYPTHCMNQVVRTTKILKNF